MHCARSSNADGTLVAQTANSVTTRSVQDLAAPLSQVLSNGTQRFVYGNPAERLFGEATGTKTWYLTDALGSLRATLSDAGIPQAAANYDAWGVPETPLIGSFGFTGELQQGSDVWLRARWYGAGRGSFGARDPYQGDAQTPYSLMYYQYGYSAPTRWIDPSGNVVRDPLREPTTCPPGMFAACYAEFDQQHSSNPYLHPSENANFAFLDAYKDEAFAYQGTDLGFDYALWRLQYKDTAEGRIALVHGAAEECGPAGGIAGIAEGANELNKGLARTYRTPARLGVQNESSSTTNSLPSWVKKYKGRYFKTFNERIISDKAIDAADRARGLADKLRSKIPGWSNANVTVTIGIKGESYYVSAFRPANPELWEKIKAALSKEVGYTWVDNLHPGGSIEAHGERNLASQGFQVIGISNTGGPCQDVPGNCYTFFNERPDIDFAWPLRSGEKP